MKKYTNSTHMMSLVEFEGMTQFLRRGDSITTDKVAINIPEGIIVEEVGEAMDKKKSKK